MKLALQDGYALSIDEKPVTDVAEILFSSGTLQRYIFGDKSTFRLSPSIEEEEAYIAGVTPEASSLAFDRTRQQVKSALRAIGAWAIREYGVSRENGCDFGSGATGFMLEELLAGQVSKPTWTQMDYNPGAVARNIAAHPDSVIRRGSYLRIKETLGFDSNLDTATGLSSLDATQDLPRAVREIKGALKPGGILLHIQDVRPGDGTGPRELIASGCKTPFVANSLPNSNGSGAFSYELNGKRVNTVELFRRQLARAIATDPDMELLGNHWVTAARKLPSAPGRIYSLNVLLQAPYPLEEASAVVTVARRKT